MAANYLLKQTAGNVDESCPRKSSQPSKTNRIRPILLPQRNVKSPVAKQVDVVAPPLHLSGIKERPRLPGSLLQSISEDSLPVQLIGTPALFRFHPTTTTVN